MERIPTLQYSPDPLRQRRLRKRRAILAVLLSAAITTAILWGPPLFHTAQRMYWQRVCLNYSLPADRLVIEDSMLPPFSNRHVPIPAEANLLYGGSIIRQTFVQTVFIHKLRRPDGQLMLVSFGLSGLSMMELGTVYTHYEPRVTVWRPTPWGNPIPQGSAGVIGAFPMGADKSFEAYAGQADPNDPAHFTFDYEADGNRHTVDGWLNDSNEIIVSQRP